jgi:hypothetical protein
MRPNTWEKKKGNEERKKSFLRFPGFESEPGILVTFIREY